MQKGGCEEGRRGWMRALLCSVRMYESLALLASFCGMSTLVMSAVDGQGQVPQTVQRGGLEGGEHKGCCQVLESWARD